MRILCYGAASLIIDICHYSDSFVKALISANDAQTFTYARVFVIAPIIVIFRRTISPIMSGEVGWACLIGGASLFFLDVMPEKMGKIEARISKYTIPIGISLIIAGLILLFLRI